MRFQSDDLAAATSPFLRGAGGPAVPDVPPTAPRRSALRASLDALRLSPPAVGVSFQCDCDDRAEPIPEDGVIGIGAEGDETRAVFRRVWAPGGTDADAAWGPALALLDDSFGGDAPFEDLAVFSGVPMDAIVGARLDRRLGCRLRVLRVHDCFEAAGAIARQAGASGRQPNAMEWNALATPGERGRYRYEILRTVRPWEIDLRGAVRDVVFEALGGESQATISARFQNTIASAIRDVVRTAGSTRCHLPVVLSGSCFRGAYLTERLRAELAADFEVIVA